MKTPFYLLVNQQVTMNFWIDLQSRHLDGQQWRIVQLWDTPVYTVGQESGAVRRIMKMDVLISARHQLQRLIHQNPNATDDNVEPKVLDNDNDGADLHASSCCISPNLISTPCLWRSRTSQDNDLPFTSTSATVGFPSQLSTTLSTLSQMAPIRTFEYNRWHKGIDVSWKSHCLRPLREM
jgi:hypothetical protein